MTEAAARRPEDAPSRADFDVVYQSSYPDMVRLAWSLVDRRDLAEEVVQDAFAALYRRFATVEHPVAYVRVCVLNNCRKVLRRRRLARRQPDPTEASVEAEHDHLFDVLRGLPTRQREVIVLRYQLGMTDAEIAEALGIPLGSVKSALSRAKDRLREELSS